MSDQLLRTQLIKLAHQVPELRKHLVPLLQKTAEYDWNGKTAMEFDTEEAMQRYLQEHPKANRANHSVKKTAPKSAPKTEPKEDPKTAPKEAPKGKARTHEELKSAVSEMKKSDHWDAVYSSAHDFDDTYGEYQDMFGDKKAEKMLEKAVGSLPTEWPDGTQFSVDTHEEDPIVDIEEAIDRGDDPDKIQGMIDAYPKLMKQINDSTESSIESMADELTKAAEKGKKPKGLGFVPGWKRAS